MRNRSNAFTQRGGDTIVMERLAEGLTRRGIEVAFDPDNRADIRQYDLCHLFNFATPELTEALARQSHSIGQPFVVTALYEDWPRFYNQMQLYYQALAAYVEAGQPKQSWAQLAHAASSVPPHARLENGWTAKHAAALLATGEAERGTLISDYGTEIRVEINHVGCDIGSSRADNSLFFDKYRIEDFVLCVGRLETRKNQLMLLKALEDSDIPLVFATGGFTYQPEYAAACKKFRRRGKTHFLERLSPEELSSAFSASRVHALASWYELPGIVSLEAARLGANVVVTEYGTSRDYFGELAFYAQPNKPEDIFNAVTAAFHRPKSESLKAHVERYTWDNSSSEVLAVYQSLLGK